MPQTYRAKDGTVHAFPDDASPEQIKAAVAQIDKTHKVMHTPPPVGSDRELFGFNSPYAKQTGLNGLEMMWAAAKDTFGSEEDSARYLAEKGGGQSSVDPRSGKPIVIAPSGDRWFVNDPGFGASDVSNLAGNIAAFAPAAKLTQGVANVGGRILTGAASSAGTDAALQLGTTGRVDPTRAAVAGAFGGGSEVIAPVVGAVYRAARTGTMTRQELVLRGRHEIAKMQQAGQLDDDTAMRLGQELDQIQAGGDPRAMLSEAEFGFRYTQGQKTGDSRQLTREEMLRAGGGRAGKILSEADQFNYDQAIGAVDDLQRNLTGRNGRVSPADVVDRVSQTVRREEGALGQRVDEAYDLAGQTQARVGQGAQADLQARIPKAIRDLDLDANTPAGLRAVEIVRSLDTRAIGKGDGGILSRSLAEIDQTRKLLRAQYGKAKTPADARAVHLVTKEFDAWLDEAATAGLVRGDPNAVALLKDARRLRTEYGQRFGDTGEFATRFDSAVRKMVKDGADPEELAKAIYGASQVSQTWANRALLRMDLAIGNNPALRKEMRAAVLTKLVEGADGQTVSLGVLQRNLRTLLNERPTLARNVLGPEGVQKVSRLVSALTPLLRTADKRSSGTTERLWRYVTSTVTGLPVLGAMLGSIKAAGDVPAATRALGPLVPKRPNIVPAVGNATGEWWQRD